MHNKFARYKTDSGLYGSDKWKHKRSCVLRRDGYIDQIDKRYGKTTEATIVHHIFPLEDYPQYAYCDWNLISVSAKNHNKLHNQDGSLTPAGEHLLQRTKEKAITLGLI